MKPGLDPAPSKMLYEAFDRKRQTKQNNIMLFGPDF